VAFDNRQPSTQPFFIKIDAKKGGNDSTCMSNRLRGIVKVTNIYLVGLVGGNILLSFGTKVETDLYF